MACIRSGLLAMGLWQLLVVASSEASSDTCDLAAGTCSTDGDDAMSAIQLRGGVQGEQTGEKSASRQHGDWPPYPKNYWRLINASSLEGVNYPKSTDKNLPKCLQGIFYMDQQCLTYDKLPSEERRYPCLGRAPPYMWVDEFTTTYGSWDPKTRCFTAERAGWTFGDAKIAYNVCSGNGIRACQVNAWTHPDPCQVGAKFGSTDLGPFKWYIEKMNIGWSRITPYWFPLTTKYPVQQIVDGDGNRTEWFQVYYNEAMQRTCKPDASKYGGPAGCRRSQWAAEGKIGMCTRSSGPAARVIAGVA